MVNTKPSDNLAPLFDAPGVESHGSVGVAELVHWLAARPPEEFNVIQKLEQVVNAVGTFLLFVLMMFIFVDVVGRNVFNQPLVGGGELSELTLALVVFLLLPSVTLRREHLSVDLIEPVAGRYLNAVSHILTASIGTVFFGSVGWGMWLMAGQTASYQDTTPSLGIPIAPVLYVVTAMSAITALIFGWRLVRPSISRQNFQGKGPSGPKDQTTK